MIGNDNQRNGCQPATNLQTKHFVIGQTKKLTNEQTHVLDALQAKPLKR